MTKNKISASNYYLIYEDNIMMDFKQTGSFYYQLLLIFIDFIHRIKKN